MIQHTSVQPLDAATLPGPDTTMKREALLSPDPRLQAMLAEASRVGWPIAFENIHSWIARWKCTNCLYRFTDYPSFALPYKQFAKGTVFDLAGHFVDDCSSRNTYRSSCNIASFGTGSELPTEQESICSHSTLWRWLSWLDRLRDGASWALGYLSSIDPQSTLHRCAWRVQPWKYRSEARGSLLRSARRSLHLFGRFEATSVSPKLQHDLL